MRVAQGAAPRRGAAGEPRHATPPAAHPHARTPSTDHPPAHMRVPEGTGVPRPAGRVLLCRRQPAAAHALRKKRREEQGRQHVVFEPSPGSQLQDGQFSVLMVAHTDAATPPPCFRDAAFYAWLVEQHRAGRKRRRGRKEAARLGGGCAHRPTVAPALSRGACSLTRGEESFLPPLSSDPLGLDEDRSNVKSNVCVVFVSSNTYPSITL